MKTNHTNEDLSAIYTQAVRAGLCRSQKDFADVTGINPSVLSQLLTGTKPVTDTMYSRIYNAVISRGVTLGDNNQTAIATAPNATAYAGVDSELLKEMKAQREMYAEHTRMYFEQISQLTAAISAIARK